jgi:hypothetical protein
VVELGDGTAAPDDDPRRPAMGSAPAAERPTTPDVGLLLLPVEEEEVSGGDRSTWQGFGTHDVDEATVASDNAVGTTGL